MKSITAVLVVVLIAAFTFSGEARIAPLRVVFISGPDDPKTEYQPAKTMPILKKYLEAKYPSIVTMVIAKGDELPGLEAIDKCDTVVLFTRRLKVQGDQLQRLKKYCTSGKPLVGIRTASHGIQTWLELDAEVFGGNYKNHYPVGPLCDVKLTTTEKLRPILDGVKPFKSQGSLYRNTGVAKDADVLMTGSIPDHTEPIAWTRMYKGGRIFYTSLGHQKDFEEESFLRLMTNAILWSAQRMPRTK